MAETFLHILAGAAWGVAVILSWLGWGIVAQRLTWRQAGDHDARQLPLGLLAGWGMACFTCLGGVLVWLHLAQRLTLVLLTVAGALLGMQRLWDRRDALRGSNRYDWLVTLPFAALLLFLFLGGMQQRFVSLSYDDFPAYLPFTHQLLDAGSLLQPFSLRRIVSYGGHTLLQSQVLSGTSDAYYCFLEAGICYLVIAWLMLALIKPKSILQRLISYFSIALLLIIGMPHTNSFSLASGAVLILTLFATLEYESDNKNLRPGYWALLGAISAATIALRINFAPGLVLVLSLHLALQVAAAPGRRKQIMLGALFCCAVVLALLLPWALALWESSATPLYPLLTGTYHEIGLFSVKASWRELADIFTLITVKAMWPLMLGILLCFTRKTAPVGVPFYLAALLVSLLVIYLNPLGNTIHAYRYSFSMLFAAELGLICLALRADAGTLQRYLALAVVLTIGVASRDRISETFDNRLESFQRSLAAAPLVAGEIAGQYREAQSKLPKGAAALVMTRFPQLFDFRRNQVLLVDMPGTCSPEPGMPMLKPKENFKQYLMERKIRYIIHDDFDRASALYPGLYYRPRILGGFGELSVQEQILAPYALYTMNAMNYFDGVAGCLIGEYGTLKVLQLY
jgi:hypothetical protein